MESFFDHTNPSMRMPMPPRRNQNISQNHQILDLLYLLIDNYSRSHQMYMIPIESMVYRMNTSSDASMLFHLQNNTHRRMNEYHHTMRDILQLIRQIHQSSTTPTPTPPTVSPSTNEQNRSPGHPVGSSIAESILNALLQSSSMNPHTPHTVDLRSRPGTEASFTFALFPGEEDDESPSHVTDAQMRQYTETYVYQPPVFTSHYQEDRANEEGPNEEGSNSEPEEGGPNEVGPNAGPGSEPDAASNHRTCPITLEDFEPGENVIKIKVCGHVFREAALRSWFERHNLCPVCRRNIQTTEITGGAHNR